MFKTLLGSAATLAFLTTTAQAGPALDRLVALFPEGAEVSFEAEGLNGLVERYDGLEIRVPGTTVSFDQVNLSETETTFDLTGQGVLLTGPEGNTTHLTSATLSAPLSILTLADIPSAENTPDPCQVMREPIRLQFEGVRMEKLGAIGVVSLEAAVRDPDGICLLDLTQSVRGAALVPSPGVALNVEEQSLKISYPLLMGLPEKETGETYGSEMLIQGVSLHLDGKEQLRIGEIRTHDSLEADSTLPLVSAGYNRHLEAIRQAAVAMRAPEMQLPYADLWNGLRAINTGASVQVTALEVVGPDLAAVVPIPGLLVPGSRHDLDLTLTKTAETVRLGFKIDGTNTLLLDLDGSVRVEAADPSFNETGPRALLMSVPFSLLDASIRISDRGIGPIVEGVIGAEPYGMASPALSGLIGAQNAERVSTWISAARSGGEARLTLSPQNPVPLLMIGMFAFSDWAGLAPMLNPTQ